MVKKTHVVFYRKWNEDPNQYLFVRPDKLHEYKEWSYQATAMTYKQAVALATKLNRQSVRDGHGRYWGVTEVNR